MGGPRPIAVNAQSLAVKRAEVEFHNFAALGEPERAMAVYAAENARRGGLIRKHQAFIGPLTPFLEIGANAGHTSYLLANEFGAGGFALDLSAGALRDGRALMEQWRLTRAPIRIAGDACSLPFQDGSLRLVMAFQMLSQFMDIERVFLEVKRVLAPGGVFLFAEEPLRRLLSLRLYRSPYWERMNSWERRLYRWGLLGYLVRDVIGAEQEESFGIRQNHTLNLSGWHHLIGRHFPEREYEIFVPERGWAERAVKKLGVRLDPQRSVWRAARLLGGTLAAVCRKAGDSPPSFPPSFPPIERFEAFLRCPDCHGPLARDGAGALACSACGYLAPDEGGVFTLLASAERAALYPGDRPDVIDFSLPGHESRLIEGFYGLEGVFGNKFRWIGPCASARLARVSDGPQKIRIRGHAHESSFAQGAPVRFRVSANGVPLGQTTLSRPGLFVFEAPVPPAPQYTIEISASPAWTAPPDVRAFTVNLSMLRLAPLD
ncbi:MAG: methyltransferase domain-containing protein [Acidobacteria bacterium]|nr:methyltransferase domain-containing protein [Acidobacteriota bacterium]